MDHRKGDKRKEKLEGKTYNYLFVKEWLGHGTYLCLCTECGKETTATTTQLKKGLMKSCGCMHVKLLRESMKKHGDSRTRLYRIFKSMKNRCYGTYDKKIMKNYKDRNITICDEWLNSWLVFKEWALNNGYKENLTIDRIDNNKGYSPENCRWITKKEQANNKRTNVYITINNETHTMSEWCEINNINKDAAYRRITKYNWNPIDAVTKPTRKVEKYGKYSKKRKADERLLYSVKWQERIIEYNGESHNVAEWTRIVGIERATLNWRIKNGWNFENAIKTPVRKMKNNKIYNQ